VLDLHPVVGFEMEFYLADPQGGNDGKPDAPASPLTGAKPIRDGVFAIDEVNDHDSLINEIYAACKLQMIEADTTISEAGLGQFEINLVHSHDAMKAADDAAFFKQIAKGVAPQIWTCCQLYGQALCRSPRQWHASSHQPSRR
jgi:glutamine synthetase